MLLALAAFPTSERPRFHTEKPTKPRCLLVNRPVSDVSGTRKYSQVSPQSGLEYHCRCSKQDMAEQLCDVNFTAREQDNLLSIDAGVGLAIASLYLVQT